MLKTNISQLFAFCGRFGLKNLWNNYYYTRHIEYPLCFNKLNLDKGMKVLDVGSGNSIFPIYMVNRGCIVYATDLDEFVLNIENIMRERGFGQLIDLGRLKIEIQDSRNFPYPDNFFDRVSAVSTLEHIPEDGDTKSMKEIARVLKKGGRAFVSIEANAKFQEFYTKHKFYFGYPYLREYPDALDNQEGAFTSNYSEFAKNKKLFSLGFVRYYNNEAILNRLAYPSGLTIEEMGYYANKHFSFRLFLDKSRLLKFVSFFTPLTAHLSFRRLDSEKELVKLATFPAYLSNAIGYIVLKKE